MMLDRLATRSGKQMRWIDRQRLHRELLAGTFLNLGSATAVEVVANTGFDWMLIDLEHGSGALGDLRPMLLACRGSAAAPVVHIPSVDGARRLRLPPTRQDSGNPVPRRTGFRAQVDGIPIRGVGFRHRRDRRGDAVQPGTTPRLNTARRPLPSHHRSAVATGDATQVGDCPLAVRCSIASRTGTMSTIDSIVKWAPAASRRSTAWATSV